MSRIHQRKAGRRPPAEKLYVPDMLKSMDEFLASKGIAKPDWHQGSPKRKKDKTHE